jgi:hypothetical protein
VGKRGAKEQHREHALLWPYRLTGPKRDNSLGGYSGQVCRLNFGHDQATAISRVHDRPQD